MSSMVLAVVPGVRDGQRPAELCLLMLLMSKVLAVVPGVADVQSLSGCAGSC